MPLYMASNGQKCLVKKIGGLEATRHHLKNLGFIVGSKITVISQNAGDIIVQVKDARIAISRELAAKIII